MKRHDDRQRRTRHGNHVYRMVLVALLGLCLGTAVAQATTEGYARPDLLLERAQSMASSEGVDLRGLAKEKDSRDQWRSGSRAVR